MQQIIFIFTNSDSWKSLLDKEEVSITGLDTLNKDKVILRYSEENALCPIENYTNLQSKEIIFVWDGGINDKKKDGLHECEKIIQCLKRDIARIYILRHSRGVAFTKPDRTEFFKEDSHVNDSSYDKIKNILNNDGIEDKVEEIVKQVFSNHEKNLNFVLELLHSCWNTKPALNSKVVKNLEETGINVSLIRSYKELNKKPNDDLDSFCRFRDELLKALSR